jgi:hypothetical protein
VTDGVGRELGDAMRGIAQTGRQSEQTVTDMGRSQAIGLPAVSCRVGLSHLHRVFCHCLNIAA